MIESHTTSVHASSQLEPSVVPRALVLAAGRGERMRPLTDHTPKPLLAVQGKALMARTLEALVMGNVRDVVINTAWLGPHIEAACGSVLSIRQDDGSSRQAQLHYSHEGRDFGAALETLGGICRALPLLSPDGHSPFWVVAGDVYCPEFKFEVTAVQRLMASDCLAHVWLVPNPSHNPQGDFSITPDGMASNHVDSRCTFSTIALYSPQLFAPPHCAIASGNPTGERAALGPFLRRAIDLQLVSAQMYLGPWTDVGTPERLAQLNQPPTESTAS